MCATSPAGESTQLCHQGLIGISVSSLATTPFKIGLYKSKRLVESLGWAGSEKLVTPVLITLIARLHEPSTFDFVSSVLASPNATQLVICDVTRVVLQTSISEEESESKEASRRALGQLRLRYPQLVQSISQELMDADEDMKDKIEQLVLLLSLVFVTLIRVVAY